MPQGTDVLAIAPSRVIRIRPYRAKRKAFFQKRERRQKRRRCASQLILYHDRKDRRLRRALWQRRQHNTRLYRLTAQRIEPQTKRHKIN
jgi:hypothetical protein